MKTFSILQRAALLALSVLLSAHKEVEGYYLPGVNIQSFQEGDEVRLNVNKMTSTSHLYDMEYYKFPFCQPEGGPKRWRENLGEVLAGDYIESSPYVIMMRKDMYCEQVCISNLGPAQRPKLSPNKMVRLINKVYHHNWIVDNLSAASKMETDTYITTRFWQGFPVGFIAEDNKKAYIHNHVNIELFYHRVVSETQSVPEYRIVRFIVEPFSIKHDMDPMALEGDEADSILPLVVKVNRPIASCDPTIPYRNRPHTNYGMVVEDGREPQLAAGKVLFTYDVIWTEDPNTPWSSRWDVYLNLNGAIPSTVHWDQIFYSVLGACVLAAFFVYKLRRHLREDLSGYTAVNTDEEGSTARPDQSSNDGSWIRSYAHVFRPPTENPRLLAVLCGTGAQLLLTALLTISLCCLGSLSPARRGSVLMGSLLMFHINGGINGYVTARLYATFQGEDSHNATGMAATLFPGIALAIFLVLNLLAWGQGSTDCVPASTFLALLFLWILIDVPLVFIGAHRGYNTGSLVDGSFVAATSMLAPPIPYQPCYLTFPVVLLSASILPFGVLFVELYYMLASAWQEYYYYMYGFLLLTFLVMILVSVEITLIFTYFQLRHGNYVWWWRSFSMGGGIAIWIFFYSMIYYLSLQAQGLSSFMIYFLYMSLVCLAMLCTMGCVGVISSIWFHKKLFTFLEDKLGSEFLYEPNKEGETLITYHIVLHHDTMT